MTRADTILVASLAAVCSFGAVCVYFAAKNAYSILLDHLDGTRRVVWGVG